MRRIVSLALLILLALPLASTAQETYFGKNKVRYKNFDWSYIQTRHFDIHFYEGAYPTAKFAGVVLESAYVEISNELNYNIQRRVPVFVYNSHNDFQQTNITQSILSEGVGGFTEAFKNRIVIPFAGSYEEFRHVLHHELTHAVVYDLLYGRMLSSLLSRQRLFALPLWFAEGYAEYSSRHGWDYMSDMYVRDATINNYLAPIEYLGGFLAYKEGQALVKYIAETYGEEKLGQMLSRGKVLLTMRRVFEETLDITEEKLWEDFSKEMKRRYWPEIAERKEPSEIGKQLTKSRKDGSYFNERPVYTPDGDKLAIFTDKSDYTEIVLISSHDGKPVKRLVKGHRSGDLESLHSYVSGISFSPDGKRMAFVAKSDGRDAIFIYDMKKGDIVERKRFDFYNILSPAWSPDGEKIAFSALRENERNIFVMHLETDRIDQITGDVFDDKDISWLPDSRRLIFSSDRPHPTSKMSDGTDHPYVQPGAYLPGDFNYGFYNLYEMDLESLEITPLEVGLGQNTSPAVSPDGSKLAFISSRNGIDNIYIAYLDSTNYYAVTDVLTGVKSLSWSPDGKKIAFEAFNKGAWDIFILKELVPAGDNGVLAPTAFYRGDYDLLEAEEEIVAVQDHAEKHQENVENTLIDNPYREEYETYDVEDDDADEGDGGSETAQEPPKDTVITATGIYDDEFVFVSEESDDPFDTLLVDIPPDSMGYRGGIRPEPTSFDSIPGPTADGDYEVLPYKVKFTPDYVGGGFAYDTFFGLRGQSFFVFTDYLGNHQIYIASDLVNTIDQSNIQAFYSYNRKRTNMGFGLFHTKNFYEEQRDGDDFLFSDRFYGFQAFVNRPFSTFKRVEFVLSQYFIDRQYYDIDDSREDRSSKVTTSALSYVSDNIIWGHVGPVNGRRAKFTLEGGINLFDSDGISYTAAEFDYRRYWHPRKGYSFAFRVSGGASFGDTPKLYFLGGTTNWIGNRTLDAKVYEVENLYFADVVTPLRGVPYYELFGTRYGLVNAEFRFPMIDYFIMRFPLALALTRVNGVFFTDIGAAWEGSDFKGGTGGDDVGGTRLLDIKTGFGFGLRANLGFLLLRYDLAWTTNFNKVSDKPSYYFSFGADF